MLVLKRCTDLRCCHLYATVKLVLVIEPISAFQRCNKLLAICIYINQTGITLDT